MKRKFAAALLMPVLFIACNNNDTSAKTQQEAATPKTYEERVMEVESKIRNTPDWLESIQKKAKDQNIVLDSMIHKDAVWMIDEEDGKHKPGVQTDSALKK